MPADNEHAPERTDDRMKVGCRRHGCADRAGGMPHAALADRTEEMPAKALLARTGVGPEGRSVPRGGQVVRTLDIFCIMQK